jgi:hypothetical protein
MNFLQFFAQMKRKIGSLYKLGRVIAFLGLLYQIISVTISYLEYETVIDMKAISGVEQRPALTFCLYSDREFPKRTRNPFMQQMFGHLFGCDLSFRNSTTKKLKCGHFSKLVESVTAFSHRCISLYSHLLDEKLMPISGTYFSVVVDNSLKIFGLIHQSGTPTHFTGNKIEIINSTFNLIDYSSIITKLLPFPHSTDCYDYRREAKLVNGYNSREDCVVKHLERKEFAKCGCNKRWSYRAFDERNFSHICPESVKCNFDSKIRMKSLEKICKNNCYNEHYLDQFIFIKYIHSFENLDIKSLGYLKSFKYEIVFTYLAKMNFVEYLCSIGGLVSMWFGISVHDLALILVNESKKWIIRIFGLINYEKLTLIVLKFKEMISTKFDKILSKLTIIVFSILMSYQIFEVITIYLDFEIVTRFEVQQIMYLPKIQIHKEPMYSNLDELIKIYPEMKHKIVNFDGEVKQLIFSNGLRQLLMDNRLNDFHRIAETEKNFKTCHFVINNKLINCSKVNTGVFEARSCLMIVNDLTYSGIVDKSKVEKITISLNHFEFLFVNIYLSHSNFITRNVFTPQTNRKSKLTFSSFSVRKLNSIHNKCISDEELNKFGEDYFDFIVPDCYFKSLNKSYGCIFLTIRAVYFDRHILKNGYKFCKNSNVTKDSLEKIYAKCIKRSKPKCNLTNFDSKIETTKLLSNETILEFVPQKTPRIAYTETYKTDFDRLIYNCGGVLSLWFGLTPIKLVDILKYLPLISMILISKSIKMVHYLKAISIKFAQNLIIICKRFGLYLLRIGVRFAQNLIRICKRFGHFFIAHIIIFASNLIAIFMRFVRHLFRINSREN